MSNPIHGSIQIAHKASGVWTAQNPVLLEGQLGYETDTLLHKMGDGVTPWNLLSYASGGSSTGDIDGGIPSTVFGGGDIDGGGP